jgi:Carboxypeptidase regulatory-like domain
MTMLGRMWVRLLLGSLLLSSAGPLWAQSYARLKGTVLDSTQAAVPDAEVILTNAATGVTSKVMTGPSGEFVFPLVLPGSYELAATHTGFKKATVSPVVVHANDRLSLDVTLIVAAASQSVEVKAEGNAVPIVDSGQRSETLTQQQIQAFSTVGRNAEELLSLLPGVSAGGSKVYGQNFDPHVVSSATGIEGFNVNGNRSDANTFKLDGGNMDDLTGNNGSNIYPNTEFISELTVQTSNYTADQGGSPIVVTAITKSGTKDFHGEAYWTGRNARLDANDWSNNNAGIKRPDSKFNYPGFSIGGPILIPGTSYNRGSEKKLFFFFGAEWSRQTPDPGTQLADVPTAKMLTGDFSDIVFSPTCMNDPSASYLNQPCTITDPLTGNSLADQGGQLTGVTANGTGLLKSLMGPKSAGPNYADPNGIWNFAANPLFPHNVTQYVGRVDWNPSDKARIFVRLGRQDETLFSPFSEYSGENSTWTSNVPDPTPTVQEYHSRSLSVGMVSVLSPTLTNEFTFNTNVLRQPNYYQDPSLLSKQTLGVDFNGLFPSVASYPIVPQIIPAFEICDSFNTSGCADTVPGTGRWGASNLVGAGNFYKETQFEFGDNLTKVVGAHTLKFGVLIGRARNDQNLSGVSLEGQLVTSNWAGTTTGDQYADILQEHFSSYVQVNHDVRANLRSTLAEWFGTDSWKVNRRLTLEYGARWSLQGPWYDANGLGTTFDPSAYDPSDPTNPYNGVRTASCKGASQAGLPLCGTIPKTIRPYGHPVIQPRFGFSWDALGNAKAVLRGGFGQYTQRDPTNAGFGALLGPPNLFSASICCNFDLATIQATDPGSQGAFSYSQSSAIYDTKDDKVPSIYQYNLTLSSALPHSFFAEIGYVGSQSRHLQIEQNIDPIPEGRLWLPGTHLVDPAFAGSEGLAAPYAPFSQISAIEHNGNANYNGLQGTLRRQAGHSLDFIASYTYSKAMGQSDQFQTLLPNPYSNAGSYHVLSFDRTHVFSIGYQYYVPRLALGALSDSKFARGALNGWMLSGITKATSGGPVAISASVNCVQLDSGGDGGACDPSMWQASDTWFGTNAWALAFLPGSTTSPPNGIYPAYTCDPRASHGGINTGFYNTSCVSLPAFGQQGAVNPPYVKTPGYFNFDLALQKAFKLGESRRLEVRFSSFNLFNRGQLNNFSTVANFDWTLPFGATDPSQGTGTLTNGTGGCVKGIGSLGYSCGKTGHREMEVTAKFFF